MILSIASILFLLLCETPLPLALLEVAFVGADRILLPLAARRLKMEALDGDVASSCSIVSLVLIEKPPTVSRRLAVKYQFQFVDIWGSVEAVLLYHLLER